MQVGADQIGTDLIREIKVVKSYKYLGIKLFDNSKEVKDSIISSFKAQAQVMAFRFRDILPSHRVRIFSTFLKSRLNYQLLPFYF
jgi:hypothetical protein